jgi:hypothetical protein
LIGIENCGTIVHPCGRRAAAVIGESSHLLQKYENAVSNLEAQMHQEPRRYEGFFNPGRACQQRESDREAVTFPKRASLPASNSYEFRLNHRLVLGMSTRLRIRPPLFPTMRDASVTWKFNSSVLKPLRATLLVPPG